MSEDYEPGGGYMTDAELEARRPLSERARNGCLNSCAIDLFVKAFVFVGVPAWWFVV